MYNVFCSIGSGILEHAPDGIPIRWNKPKQEAAVYSNYPDEAQSFQNGHIINYQLGAETGRCSICGYILRAVYFAFEIYLTTQKEDFTLDLLLFFTVICFSFSYV